MIIGSMETEEREWGPLQRNLLVSALGVKKKSLGKSHFRHWGCQIGRLQGLVFRVPWFLEWIVRIQFSKLIVCNTSPFLVSSTSASPSLAAGPDAKLWGLD